MAAWGQEGRTTSPTSKSHTLGNGATDAFVASEIIVRLRIDPGTGEVANAAALADLQAELGAEVVSTTQKFGFQLWRVASLSTEQAMARYAESDVLEHVEYLQPNYTLSLADHRVEATPNDPRFGDLWGLHNTGQSGGTADADIDAPEAWNITTGGGVVVGVIDTGVDYTHPDLDGNMWVNSGEIAGNGIDDDLNGYVDDVYGYDFVNDDGNPFDDNDHGTHVAGTIAAEGDNGTGIAGVNWDAEIMALKFLSGSGSGTTFDAIRAVEYATLMGAQVTNNSWGGGGFSQALYDAIATAGQADQLFVAAAGNDGGNNDSRPHYPSSYDLDNILSVASTTRNDALSSFSNFGATTVDLGAPGSSILSTVPGGGYASFSGTSMATPHVAGVAALLLSEEPGLSVSELTARLLNSADPISSLSGMTVSGGRLNAYNALQTPTPGSISGSVWNDANGDGARNGAETALAGWTVFLDADRDGQLDAGETSTRTDASGDYSFDQVDAGSYDVAQVVPSGWEQTAPVSSDTYRWSDSNQAGGPSFVWTDISAIGTRLSLSDDSSREVSLPFGFDFFGDEKTSVRISSNGYLTFGGDGTDYTNDPIPGATDPNDLIAPFWDDLNPSRAGDVYHHSDTANDRFIVQYDGLGRYSGSGDYTFQAILEADGDILFQYQDMQGLLTSATIGLENAAGNAGTQVAYNAGYVENGLAVRFSAADGTAVSHRVDVGFGRDVADVDFGNRATTPSNGEVGRIGRLTDDSQTIQLANSYSDPVVFVLPASQNGAQTATVRVEDVTAGSFTVRMQEPNHLDGTHIGEQVSYIVLEAGTWELANGALLEVGRLDSNRLSSRGFDQVDFAHDFTAAPLVFSQVQTDNGRDFVQTRVRNVDARGFEITMQEEEALNGGGHVAETLGWFALTPGSGEWNGLSYAATRTSNSVTDAWFDHAFASDFGNAPQLLASLATFNGGDPAGLRYRNLDGDSVQIRVAEDRSLDNEIAHVAETVNVLAIGGSGRLTAERVTAPTISGLIWNDLDLDGTRDSGETGLESRTVYLDANDNGRLDAGERSVQSDASGTSLFAGLSAGSYNVRQVVPVGWQQVSPLSSTSYQVATGDQDGGPLFDWTDISGIGTRLSLSDDSSSLVSLPFGFDFFGDEKTSVRISSNGYLTFGNNGAAHENGSIPGATDPNDLIAPFWDDLNPARAGDVYHHSDTVNDRFIVQYDGLGRYSGSGDYTFQAILEADGDILFQYQDMQGLLTSATIGIENAAGNAGIESAFNEAFVSDGLAVRYRPEALAQSVTLGANQSAAQVDFGNRAEATVMAEFGRITGLDDRGRTIQLEHDFDNPVLFVLPPSQFGGQTVTVRIEEVGSDSFTLRAQEPNHLDGKHLGETVSYIVLESGAWRLDGGVSLEVGSLETARLTSSGFETIDFDIPFSTAPVVFSQVQTANGGDFVQTRMRSHTDDGFQVAMEEEEALNGGRHVVESVGWFAITPGNGTWDGHAFEAARSGPLFDDAWRDFDFSTAFTEAPQLFAALASHRGSDPAGLRYSSLDADGVRLRVAEDRSRDAETNHVQESIDVFAIAGSGTLTAEPLAFSSKPLLPADPLEESLDPLLPPADGADIWLA